MIRLVQPAKDVDAILEIYAPIVANSHWSFEIDVPSKQIFQERLERIMRTHPFLVMESESKVVGYAYATSLRNRAAYAPSTETSIYLHPTAQGAGSGRKLYQTLFSILELSGYSQLFAGATLPNKASAAFHNKMGFVQVGVWPKVGFKFNKWWDVGWWHRSLSPNYSNPMRIIPWADLKKKMEFTKMLDEHHS